MRKLLLLATGAFTICLGTLAPVYADPPITEPPLYLRSAANGLLLNKAQVNGQYVCLEEIKAPIKLSNAGTPWVSSYGTSVDFVDISSFPFVSGSVSNGRSIFKTTVSNTKRHFKGNGLPTHNTGVFPVQEGTPAYSWYAAAPGGPGYSSSAAIPIARYDLDITVPRNPTYSKTPYCMTSLVMGVATQTHTVWHINLAYGSTPVDPIAALPVDECWGHPFNKEYHYHGYSWKCMPNQGSASTHSPLFGYAMDGFGIYGPRGDNGILLTNDDLDECHGHTGRIKWDGKWRTMYHYHLNSQYPYGPGCYRGKPSNFNAFAPGGGDGQPLVFNALPSHSAASHGFPEGFAEKYPPRVPLSQDLIQQMH